MGCTGLLPRKCSVRYSGKKNNDFIRKIPRWQHQTFRWNFENRESALPSSPSVVSLSPEPLTSTSLSAFIPQESRVPNSGLSLPVLGNIEAHPPHSLPTPAASSPHFPHSHELGKSYQCLHSSQGYLICSQCSPAPDFLFLFCFCFFLLSLESNQTQL